METEQFETIEKLKDLTMRSVLENDSIVPLDSNYFIQAESKKRPNEERNNLTNNSVHDYTIVLQGFDRVRPKPYLNLMKHEKVGYIIGEILRELMAL